jgi:hypothetical protein
MRRRYLLVVPHDMTQPPATPGPDEASDRPAAGVPQYDPSVSYVVYETVVAAPTGDDPLISPDYGGWWRRSGALFLRTWTRVLPLQLAGFVVGLAVAIPEALVLNRFLADYSAAAGSDPPVPPDAGAALGVLGMSLVLGTVNTLVISVISVAVYQLAVSAAAGRPLRFGAALGLAVRRGGPLLGWRVLGALLIGAGFCACFLPAVYIYAVLTILPAVVTFERGGAGIGRCFKLFHNSLGVAAGRIATVMATGVVLAGVSAVIRGVVVWFDGGSRSTGTFEILSTAAIVVSTVIGELLAALLRTFTSIMVLTAYADLRARLEPLCTATLAAEIGIVAGEPGRTG